MLNIVQLFNTWNLIKETERLILLNFMLSYLIKYNCLPLKIKRAAEHFPFAFDI